MPYALALCTMPLLFSNKSDYITIIFFFNKVGNNNYDEKKNIEEKVK